MKALVCGWTIAVVALIGVPADAAEFPVGRASVQLPGDAWRVIVVADKGYDYGGEVSGTIKSETKVFVRQSATGGVDAILTVRGSGGGMRGGYMAYNPDCKSDSNWYAKGNFGFNTSFVECTKVMRQYSAMEILKAAAPGILEALLKDSVPLPGGLYPVMSYYANSNRTFLEVRAFLGPGFLGRDGQVSESLPTGVEAQVVLWSRELAASVRKSVNSMSGAMVLPSVEFAK